jgi:hypothetical protein
MCVCVLFVVTDYCNLQIKRNDPKFLRYRHLSVFMAIIIYFNVLIKDSIKQNKKTNTRINFTDNQDLEKISR